MHSLNKFNQWFNDTNFTLKSCIFGHIYHSTQFGDCLKNYVCKNKLFKKND